MSAIPELAATHHAAITVTDFDASLAWYEQVFGFTKFMEGPHPGGYAVLLIEPRSQVILAVHRHDANSGERFSETRTGLDHIGWSVPRREDLDAWQARLESLGVTFTPVVDVEEQGLKYSVIVLRDPDNIQLELCWTPAG
jgi:glyoxylase I family protein